MHLGTEGFQDHARQALKDEPLQNALHLLTTEFVPRRVAAMQALGDPEALRTQARAVKEQAIAQLDTYLEQFADNLDKLGAHVHWAHDDAEARDIITSIAQQAEAKVIVKGKSMAAEEIHLNPHLKNWDTRSWRPTSANTSSSSPKRRHRTSSRLPSTRPGSRSPRCCTTSSVTRTPKN